MQIVKIITHLNRFILLPNSKGCATHTQGIGNRYAYDIINIYHPKTTHQPTA